MPGKSPSAPSTPAAVARARGRPKTCSATAVPRCSPVARVTTMPALVETSKAGSCETSPSPTVSSV